MQGQDQGLVIQRDMFYWYIVAANLKLDDSNM